jgi:hypothetical protein
VYGVCVCSQMCVCVCVCVCVCAATKRVREEHEETRITIVWQRCRAHRGFGIKNRRMVHRATVQSNVQNTSGSVVAVAVAVVVRRWWWVIGNLPRHSSVPACTKPGYDMPRTSVATTAAGESRRPVLKRRACRNRIWPRMGRCRSTSVNEQHGDGVCQQHSF